MHPFLLEKGGITAPKSWNLILIFQDTLLQTQIVMVAREEESREINKINRNNPLETVAFWENLPTHLAPKKIQQHIYSLCRLKIIWSQIIFLTQSVMLCCSSAWLSSPSVKLTTKIHNHIQICTKITGPTVARSLQAAPKNYLWIANSIHSDNSNFGPQVGDSVSPF